MTTHAKQAVAVATAALVALVTAAQRASFATFITLGNYAFAGGPVKALA